MTQNIAKTKTSSPDRPSQGGIKATVSAFWRKMLYTV